ncbi:GNAT family N-acetyltransferase [Larkinella sp. VNQ87]|uniref:GNAT family N-acetyltransferase n=1 Tax=Larkinella sp. VNQ87 TaxID=3400921 RepID=UPI003C014272
MNTPIEIRIGTPNDAVPLTDLAIRTMRAAFGPPHNPADVVDAYIKNSFSVEQMQQELNDPKNTFLLAVDSDSSLIGYAKLRRIRPPRQLQGQRAIEIQRLYVAETQIGRGLGRQLMERCWQEAQLAGYPVVWLGVWERNERAIGFYKQMGFERCGWHYFQFGPERQRDFWMKKDVV